MARREGDGDDQREVPPSASEVFDLLDSMSPEEAFAWLNDHAGELSDEQFNGAYLFATTAGSDFSDAYYVVEEEGGRRMGAGWEPPSSTTVSTPDLEQAQQQAEDQQADVEQAQDDQEAYDASIAAAGEFGGNFIIENQGVPGVEGALRAQLETEMPEGLSPSAQQQWLREAQARAREFAIEEIARERQGAGQSEGAARQSAEEDVAATTSIVGTPQWMLQDANDLGYRFTSENGYGVAPELQQRFLDYYNAQYGTSFDDFDLLTSQMQEPLNEVRDIWQAALLGDEPTLARSVEIPGTEAVTLSQEDIDILVGNYGLSSDGVNRLVRLAYMNRGVDAEGNARPVDLYALAAAARGMGLTVGLADRERRDREIEQMEQRIEDLRNSDWGPDVSGKAAEIARLEKQLFSMRRMNTETSGGGPNAPGIHGIRNSLYTGLERYDNNQVLAVLHVLDPGLASRIAATGGDVDKLDPRDNARAYDLLIDAGVVERDKNGFRPDNAILAQMASYFGIGGRYGGGGGGGGTVRRVLDQTVVKQAADAVWQSLLREDAPPELVAAFGKQLQGALDKSPQGQDFGLEARIKQWVESQPRYAQLYGKRPEGVSPEEWMAQFISGQQSILGTEVPMGADPVTLGMESGSYQTAVGAAAGTKEAWNNSSWLERLANAASVVASNT